MLMSTPKLLLLRVYNISIGRVALFDRLLRWLLVKVLVHSKKRGDKYVASSRFFDVNELQ